MVPGHGDPDARLLVVGLAPGAHGANRTGRLFTGDESSQWLASALFLHRFANGRLAFETTAGLLGGLGLVFRHGAVYRLPSRPILVASYHPSQQNTRTGLLTPAMWMEVFGLVRRELGPGQTFAVRLAPGTDSGIMEA